MNMIEVKKNRIKIEINISNSLIIYFSKNINNDHKYIKYNYITWRDMYFYKVIKISVSLNISLLILKLNFLFIPTLKLIVFRNL